MAWTTIPRRRLPWAIVGLAVAGLGHPVVAETYPSRQITLVIPFAPGGTGDIVGRVIAEKLAPVLGQPIVVENRAGATGTIGARSVATAAPDGHTLLVGQTGEIAIVPQWGKAAGYDPARDLQPVALATIVPLALVAPANAPYATVAEMIEAARTNKGQSFASSGTGTPGHLAAELLKFRTQSNMVHVPYKGAGPALNDLLGGHVDFFFPGLPAAVPHVKAGTLKILAVSSARRSSAVPDTPTVAETPGLSGFDITLWQGFFAPHGTPKEVIDRLNLEINRILNDPEVKAKFLEAGADVAPMSVAEFSAFVTVEIGKFAEIIKAANVKTE